MTEKLFTNFVERPGSIYIPSANIPESRSVLSIGQCRIPQLIVLFGCSGLSIPAQCERD
jgi:hypothetical protein